MSTESWDLQTERDRAATGALDLMTGPLEHSHDRLTNNIAIIDNKKAGHVTSAVARPMRRTRRTPMILYSQHAARGMGL